MLMYKTKLYKIRPVYKGADLFTTARYYNKWEAVCDVLDDDRYKRSVFKLQNPAEGGKCYKHQYDKYQRGFAFMKVGQSKKKNENALVVVNLKSRNGYDPFVIVGAFAHGFMSHKQIAEMLKDAINTKFENSDMIIELKPWNIKAEEKKVLWAKDCIESYYMSQFENDEEEKVPRKSDNFRDYISYPDKDLVISELHRVLATQRCSKDVSRPVRFLCDHKILKWPPFCAFIKEFDEVIGHVSESRYNHFTYEFTNPYKGDDRYDSYEGEFEILLKNWVPIDKKTSK